MRIVSYWYGSDESIYARLARVLKYSAHKHGHEASIIRGPELPANRSEAFVLKARDWTRAITEAKEPIVLLDVDTYVRGSLEHVFKSAFNVACTRDDKGRLNSGVLFVRPGPTVSAFFSCWEELTEQWCAKNTPDAIRYGDQDALAVMLRNAPILVRDLPMHKYNSTQRTWARGFQDALIVHVKSDARKYIERGSPITTPGAEHVVCDWIELERQCLKETP